MSSPETEIDSNDSTPEEKPPLTLDVQVTEPSACQRHVTVTISQEDVNRYKDEAYTEMMPSANVPGFRSGRAPRKLVEQRYREQVGDQVKGSLLMDSMTQITEQHDFSAISEPDFDFDAVEMPDEGPLKFEFDLEVRPEFDMPNWKGLKLDNLKRDFSKPDVDREIEQLLGAQGQLVPFDGKAGPNDYVIVNARCEFEGRDVASHEELTVRIKPTLSFHDARIEDFAKLMVGAAAEDKRSAQATVSHDAVNLDLQGKTLDVELEVLEVKKLEPPELDEETLGQFDVENEGELRDKITDVLNRRMAYQQQQRTRKQITALLTESADWDLPPDLLKRQSKRELDRAVLELRSNGFNEEDIRAYENELRQNSLTSTKTALQEHFILERIAEDEQIDAEPGDFDAEVTLIAAQSNEPVRRVRARIEKKGLMDSLRNQIIERKVVELITSKAEFKDVDYKPENNEVEAVDAALCGLEDSEIPEAKHGGDAQALQQPTDRS